MAEYVLFTDSCCDLTDALAKEMQLTVLPLSVHMDDETYQNLLDESEITYKDFYAKLPGVKDVKTSAVNQQAFTDAMEPILQSGRDLLYIGFSSGLSGTYSAGALAAQELAEKYPERKIYAVDSLCASLGQGMYVYLAWQKKCAGATIEEVRDYLEEIKMNLCHWFTVNDLFHLKKGGRVSATTAILGSMLSIKPVMHVDDEGHLTLVSKARGRKASIKQLLQEMKNTAIDPENQVIFISHGDAQDDAEYLGDMIRKELHVKDVIINYVGPVIGAHAGPGVIALFFLGTKR
ncbi:MAG: DegV family protein [Clostridia bacterium]|nr:DegV family protein [Clostridia bacterium]